jgi:hypothetical protein
MKPASPAQQQTSPPEPNPYRPAGMSDEEWQEELEEGKYRLAKFLHQNRSMALLSKKVPPDQTSGLLPEQKTSPEGTGSF